MQFSNIQRGLFSMLVPVALGAIAMAVIVERPFEKRAEATQAPVVQSTILAPGTSEKVVETPLIRFEPMVIVGQAPASKRSHIARPLNRECWQGTPGSECNIMDLAQGTGTVLVCTCK